MKKFIICNYSNCCPFIFWQYLSLTNRTLSCFLKICRSKLHSSTIIDTYNIPQSHVKYGVIAIEITAFILSRRISYRSRTQSEACQWQSFKHLYSQQIYSIEQSFTFDKLKHINSRPNLGRSKAATDWTQQWTGFHETPQTSIRQLTEDHDMPEGSIRKKY